MSEFYLIPKAFVLAAQAMLFLTAALQTLVLSFGFRPLEHSRLMSADILREFMLLAESIIAVMLVSDVLFHTQQGLIYPSNWGLLRCSVFVLLALSSLLCARRKQRPSLLLVLLPAAVTLPPAESLPGFVPVFFAAVILWTVRSVRLFALRLSERQGQLTASSIKEVLDQLDSGLLYAQKNGQILLQNQLMQRLMVELGGKLQVNGREFYEMLLSGPLRPECRRLSAENQLFFQLANGSVWNFSLLPMDGGARVLLLASDVTEWWSVSQSIQEQNAQLREKNAELTRVLSNLEDICRSEAVLQAKGRVHDVLGQNISLLLRAMREHREPDDVLLRSFADGLPRELKEVTSDGGYSLDTLAKVFRDLGVILHVDGWLPQEEELARVFYEIAVEAVTNAVRHGYATQVFISFTQGERSYKMEVRNRGLLPDGPVKEGGGLRGMREKIRSLGGKFSYDMEDGFRICAELPRGGSI